MELMGGSKRANPTEGFSERRKRGRPKRSFSSACTPPPSMARSNTHFFKVYFPEQSSQSLRIPPAFYKNIESVPLGPVTLRGPGGSTWFVELAERSNGLHFESGWKLFLADHSIEAGDFLLFRYDGSSGFSVLMFDPSACEKESALLARPYQSEDDKSIVLSPTEFKASGIGSAVSHTRSVIPHSNKLSLVSSMKSLANYYPGPRSREVVGKTKRAPAIISQRRSVTQDEIDTTLNRAKEFKSENAFFMTVMRHSYVYSSFFLSIATQFVKDHLPKNTTKMTLLDSDGKTWPVTYVCYSGRHGALSGGWGHFAVAHNLELHDVCVFEVVKRNQFKVHIFRVVDEIAPFIRGSAVKNQIA